MITDLLKDTKTAAVLCNQWGDTGKGKFVDEFAMWADVIARGTGGPNAGHTVVINGVKYVFHLIPSGITWDGEGKINIIGNGTAIDLQTLVGELDDVTAAHGSYDNLHISKDAQVILPFHVVRDRAKNKNQADGGIGSTGRGMGPCYEDKIGRRGITIGDLYDTDVLRRKLERIAACYPEQQHDLDGMIAALQTPAQRIRPLVRDTGAEMRRYVREGRKVLLEGAQGLMLSIEHGSYPYVTSSDCSLAGTASGVGISAGMVDTTLQLVKFPFMTRVGAGPFPTELGGQLSEWHCGADGQTKETELRFFGIPYTKEDGSIKYDLHDRRIIEMINSKDQFIKGIGIRLIADEYGATTGRPRRTGWTDAELGRYSAQLNKARNTFTVLTKPDCLAGMREFSLCVGYQDPFDKADLANAEPVYERFDGYDDISGVRAYDGLPAGLKKAIARYEEMTEERVGVISVGPERSQTIVR